MFDALGLFWHWLFGVRAFLSIDSMTCCILVMAFMEYRCFYAILAFQSTILHKGYHLIIQKYIVPAPSQTNNLNIKFLKINLHRNIQVLPVNPIPAQRRRETRLHRSHIEIMPSKLHITLFPQEQGECQRSVGVTVRTGELVPFTGEFVVIV